MNLINLSKASQRTSLPVLEFQKKLCNPLKNLKVKPAQTLKREAYGNLIKKANIKLMQSGR